MERFSSLYNKSEILSFLFTAQKCINRKKNQSSPHWSPHTGYRPFPTVSDQFRRVPTGRLWLNTVNNRRGGGLFESEMLYFLYAAQKSVPQNFFLKSRNPERLAQSE